MAYSQTWAAMLADPDGNAAGSAADIDGAFHRLIASLGERLIGITGASDATADPIIPTANRNSTLRSELTTAQSTITTLGTRVTNLEAGTIHFAGDIGSGSRTIDWDLGLLQMVTAQAGGFAVTFSNKPTGIFRLLILCNNGAATWPTTVWAGGTAPDLNTMNRYLVTFLWDGTDLRGSFTSFAS